jgi:hypothetical protein
MTNDTWKCKCENNPSWLMTVDRCSLCGETRPEGLSAEEAMGVALSIPMGNTEMGECQRLAPGVVKHLFAMGWKLERVTEEKLAVETPNPAPDIDRVAALEAILRFAFASCCGFKGAAKAALDFCQKCDATEVKALREKVAALTSERDGLKRSNDRDQLALATLGVELFDLGCRLLEGETVATVAARSLRENVELVRTLKGQLAKLQGLADQSPESDRLRRAVTDMQMGAGQMAAVAEGR